MRVRRFALSSLALLSLVAFGVPAASAAGGSASAPSTSRDLLAKWGVGNTEAALPPTAANPVTTAMWRSANPDIILAVNSLNNGKGFPLRAIMPGETVMLTALWGSLAANAGAQPVPTNPTWTVFPATATINTEVKVSSVDPGSGPPNHILSDPVEFTAQTPGEYVVQATWGSFKSVPLVLDVGVARMSQAAAPTDPAYAGVIPVAFSLLSADAKASLLPVGSARAPLHQVEGDSIAHLFVGRPVGGWLPVCGEAPASWLDPAWPDAIQVNLWHSGKPLKSYLLPLTHGVFSDVVAVPFRGDVLVTFTPAFYGWRASSTSTERETILLNVPSAAVLPVHLQASALLDFNNPVLCPALDVAATLWRNAPDPQSGIQAISNWAGAYVSGNLPIIVSHPGFSTASQVYRTGMGLYQDNPDFLVALLRGIGVPSQIVQGYVSDQWSPSGSPTTDSELLGFWAQSDLPAAEMPLDIAMSGRNLLNQYYVTNAYTWPTLWFTGTHSGGRPTSAQ